MPKVDWANLELIEEWPEFNPGDSGAILRKQEQLALLSKMVLEIYVAMKKTQAKKRSRKIEALEEKEAKLCEN